MRTSCSLSFAPSPDENYQRDTSATPTDTGAVAAVKLLFQGKVGSAEEATYFMHLQRAVTKTQLSTTTPWQPPQSDPRNDEAVNIMLERILKNTPVTVQDALIIQKGFSEAEMKGIRNWSTM